MAATKCSCAWSSLRWCCAVGANRCRHCVPTNPHAAGRMSLGMIVFECRGGAIRLLPSHCAFCIFDTNTQNTSIFTIHYIFRFDDDGEAARWGSHPNHKPFSVLEPLIRGLTRTGDLILDPFAGSGSSLAAAQRLQRHSFGLEIEPQWVELIQKRLAETSSE